MNAVAPATLSARQAATYLSCGLNRLYRLAALIGYERPAGRMRFTVAALDAYRARHTVAPPLAIRPAERPPDVTGRGVLAGLAGQPNMVTGGTFPGRRTA